MSAECAEPNAFHDWVTWLLVIVGWIVINAQHNLRVTRNEIRQRLDLLREDLHKLEGASMLHHTVENDPARRAEVRRMITTVATSISVLTNAGLEVRQRFALLTSLRQAITLENFDEDYEPLPMDHRIVLNIGAAIAKILSSTEDAYAQRYHRPIRTRIGLT